MKIVVHFACRLVGTDVPINLVRNTIRVLFDLLVFLFLVFCLCFLFVRYRPAWLPLVMSEWHPRGTAWRCRVGFLPPRTMVSGSVTATPTHPGNNPSSSYFAWADRQPPGLL